MQMSESDDALVIRGGLVIPMARDREFFEGDVTVRNGRIEAVGESGSAAGARVLAADGAVVLPGFVQGHVHVVQSLLRHQADGLELLDWLRLRTLPYEGALDGDGVEAAAELGIAELLTGGTTTALDFGTTHDHQRVFEAAERLGIRLVSGKTHMDVADGAPPQLVEDTERGVLAHRAVITSVSERRLLAPSPSSLRKVGTLVRMLRARSARSLPPASKP